MIKFILNNETVETDLPRGMTVLDFVRYRKNLKGTKIGCREGDCGACTLLVGEPTGDEVRYRSMTSCLMPLANAEGKHIVSVEGINRPGNELTGVQKAMVDESGTQCGFCTVGFVMSLTGFCVDETPKTPESAISAIDGNICRCTGYKSIERAAGIICDAVTNATRRRGDEESWGEEGERRGSMLGTAISSGVVPEYFSGISERLAGLRRENPKSEIPNLKLFVGGGTDLYVQRPDDMVTTGAENLFDNTELREIRESGEFVEIGGSATVTDLLVSPAMQRIFPKLYKHLKLVSSTPIRNMATLAGNFVNASPIGDMTAWFLGLNASIVFNTGRELPLKDFYLAYKTLAREEGEFIRTIRFRRDVQYFNFEKVSKRTYLDIASVNSAISLRLSGGGNATREREDEGTGGNGDTGLIAEAHVSAGGVAPTPLYLRKTSEFLRGKEINGETISAATEIMQSEVSPISDVRGSAEYKRLLLRQLFMAHFVELFDLRP
jgi:xanthine dehydrogenase small subunit